MRLQQPSFTSLCLCLQTSPSASTPWNLHEATTIAGKFISIDAKCIRSEILEGMIAHVLHLYQPRKCNPCAYLHHSKRRQQPALPRLFQPIGDNLPVLHRYQQPSHLIHCNHRRFSIETTAFSLCFFILHSPTWVDVFPSNIFTDFRFLLQVRFLGLKFKLFLVLYLWQIKQEIWRWIYDDFGKKVGVQFRFKVLQFKQEIWVRFWV